MSDVNDVLAALDGTNLNEASSVVSFAGRGLKLDNEEDCKEFVDTICESELLETLNLEGNTVGVDAAKAIGKALESKYLLKRALLKDLFTGRLKTEIPDAIRYLTAGISLSGAKLNELDLSDNAFGPIALKALIPFLQSPACSELRILRLNNNGLGSEGGKLLARGLSSLKQLQVLICGRNRLENEGATAVGKVLSDIMTLEVLEVPQNGIRAEGMEALAMAIAANINLRVLNLNDNIMGIKGTQAIAEALKSTRNIQIINFGDCLIRKAGCISLLESLKEASLPSLKELILNGNEIGGSEASQLIIKMFDRNDRDLKNLRLDLSVNNFGYGCIQLKETLEDKVDLILSDDEGSLDENVEDESEEEENEGEGDATEDEEEANYEDNPIFSEKSKSHPSEAQLSEVVKRLENENADLDTILQNFIELSINYFDYETLTLSENVLEITDSLLKLALTKETNSFRAANSLLSHLGLIKSEEGYHKKERDLGGPFYALLHAIGLLDKTHKDVLQMFMSKYIKGSDKTQRMKHNLMQSLFR